MLVSACCEGPQQLVAADVDPAALPAVGQLPHRDRPEDVKRREAQERSRLVKGEVVRFGGLLLSMALPHEGKVAHVRRLV